MRHPRSLPGLADGSHYRDICNDTAACPVCSLWRQDGESREAWIARIRAAYHAAPREFREKVAS